MLRDDDDIERNVGLTDGHLVLKCPCCRDVFLHHHTVEVFDRREDAARGQHVTVLGGRVGVDDDLTGNPSPRRSGLRIEFFCESCGAEPVLTVAQHKGSTRVAVEPAGPRAGPPGRPTPGRRRSDAL